MKTRVLVVSSANMDLSMPISCIPTAGQTLLQQGKVTYTPGGKGANSAVAFSRLGGDCVFCTKIGQDAHGESLYKYYQETKINTDYMAIDRNSATGFAAIFVEANGQNRIMVYPGANNQLTDGEVESAFLCLPDALYLQTEIPFARVITAASIAFSRGIPIFLDAGPAVPDAPLEQLPELEIFSPNEEETFAYTGIRLGDVNSCLAAAMALTHRVKAKYIVLKLGKRGAYVYGNTCHIIPSYNVYAVDTTAAGDAFTAAMTLRYLENGHDIVDAVRYANAVGALTVSRPGAGASVPTQEEAELFYQNTALPS